MQFPSSEPSQEELLFAAVAVGDPAEVRRLLDAGVSPDASRRGETALEAAIRHRKADLIDLLAGAGADVNRPDFTGKTPLMFALDGKDPEAVRRLLDRGADPNAQHPGQPAPIIHAVRQCESACVGLLIARGARLDATAETAGVRRSVTFVAVGIALATEGARGAGEEALRTLETLLASGAEADPDARAAARHGSARLNELLEASGGRRERRRAGDGQPSKF